MMLIHPPVNPYSSPGAIRDWIEVLKRWRAEPTDDPEDYWIIDSNLASAREWLIESENRERAASEPAPVRRRRA